MPTTRGSSSGGVSAGAISGSEQQEDPVMDVDPPTNEPIDVDEDMSQTDDKNKVRHLRVLLKRSRDRSCTRSCSSSHHPSCVTLHSYRYTLLWIIFGDTLASGRGSASRR